MQPILQRINKIINDLRAENGYAMVFDAQANGGSVVAADKNLDITDQVIARLQDDGPRRSGGIDQAGGDQAGNGSDRRPIRRDPPEVAVAVSSADRVTRWRTDAGRF